MDGCEDPPETAVDPIRGGNELTPGTAERQLDPGTARGAAEHLVGPVPGNVEPGVAEQQQAERLAEIERTAKVCRGWLEAWLEQTAPLEPRAQIRRRPELLRVRQQLPRVHEIPNQLRRLH